MDSIFKETRLMLLAGKFIDNIKHPSLYEFLENDDNRAGVVNFLSEVDCTLKQTPDAMGYYAVQNSLAKSKASFAYKEICTTMQPVLFFLHLISGAENNSENLKTSNLLRFPELLRQINGSPSYQEELQRHVKNLKDIKAEHTVEAYLRFFMNYLEDKEYVTPKDDGKQVYEVTSKASWFYEQLEYWGSYFGFVQNQMSENKQPAQESFL